jgi:SWI/SNF-related matrix-associated actin-dependent regulator 1 of chromatin subfamily A
MADPSYHVKKRGDLMEIHVTSGYCKKSVRHMHHLTHSFWNKKKKRWYAPFSYQNVTSMKLYRTTFSDKAKRKVKAVIDKHENQGKDHINRTVPKLKLKKLPLRLEKAMYPYQKEGFQFAVKQRGRVLIADEMGLGKSLQAISFLSVYGLKGNPVVVCPATLKFNWEDEIHKWTDRCCIVLEGFYKREKVPDLQAGDIIIINYDILMSWKKWLRKLDLPVLTIDECHYIKNRKSQRSRACCSLGKKAKRVLALSGTPIENRPIEFFAVIKLLHPELFTWYEYTNRYCGARETGFGMAYDGASNTEEFHKLLTSTIMIRRKKEDVLKDLPPKSRSKVLLSVDTKGYREVRDDFAGWAEANMDSDRLDKAMKAEVLVKLTEMRKAIALAKSDAVIEWIENFLQGGRKLVVFTRSKRMQKLILKYFGNIAVGIDGSVKGKKRKWAKNQFQNNDRVRLLVGNIVACAEGLTLTAASDTCHVEFMENPMKHDQGEDRVHRIGQTCPCKAYYLLAKGTMDEQYYNVHNMKREVIAQVLDGKKEKNVNVIREILKGL